jgi:two-component system OmpR family sensor kinase/two-component system sensor histidine kinase BaeS
MHDTTASIRNRLFLLLLRAFGIVILIYFALTLATTGIVLTRPTEANPLRQLPTVGRLETYYIARGSWDGVTQAFSPGAIPAPENVQFQQAILLDAGNRIVVYKGRAVAGGAVFNSTVDAPAIPIVVRGASVGTLVLDPNSPSPERAAALRFLRPVVLLSLPLVIFALVIGLLLTRRVVTPLAEVIAAAEEVAAGNLSTRVTVQGPHDLRALSDSFNQMAGALEQNDRERRGMLADIAHELRTPLSILRGRLEGVMDGVYPADQEHIVPALEETYLLERLVDDLRLLTLAESGQLSFEEKAVNLNDLSRRVLSLFEAQAAESGIELSLQSDAPDATASLDPQRTEQVIGNLVGNALRFTPQGGKIWVEIHRPAGQVTVSINDNGPGVPEEELPLIFNRFWRSDKSRARVSGGAGLGLAIARQLIEGQGGKISASNLPPGGLRVEFSFPTE